MSTPIHTGPNELPEFARECEESLLSKVDYEFLYPEGCSLQNWPVEEIKTANKDFLNRLRGSANVYAFFVRRPDSEEWTPKYVGQRKSAELRERMTQHLIKKDPQIGSMLEKVKTAVVAGEKIGISFIKILPESLRLYVEETIISSRKSELPWNTHG